MARASDTVEHGERSAVVAELTRLVRQLPRHAEQSDCAIAAAELVLGTATAWHAEAVGTATGRGTQDRETMKQSVALYRLVDTHFTAAQLEALGAKRDGPDPAVNTLATVRFALADLLWYQGLWTRCGPAFDRAVEANPMGPLSADATFAAAQCRANARRTPPNAAVP